jgi:hypothetical protein
VPGVSAVGIERNDSRGDTASVLAESIPYLSQPKYLPQVSCLVAFYDRETDFP